MYYNRFLILTVKYNIIIIMCTKSTVNFVKANFCEILIFSALNNFPEFAILQGFSHQPS